MYDNRDCPFFEACVEDKCNQYNPVARICTATAAPKAPQQVWAAESKIAYRSDFRPFEDSLRDLSKSDRQERADIYFAKGEKLYFQRFFHEALCEFIKASIADTSYVEAFVRAGDIYCYFQVFEEAILQYKEALKLQPRRGRVWVKQLFQYRQLHKDSIHRDQMHRRILNRLKDQAVEATDKAMLHFALGMAYLILPIPEIADRARQMALTEFDAARKVDQHCLWAYWGEKYSNLYFGAVVNNEAVEGAIKTCLKALTLAPSSAEAHFEMAEAYELAIAYFPTAERDLLPKAIDEYTKATEIDPFYAPAFARLGALQRFQYRYPKAAEALERAIQYDPMDALSLLNMARSQRAMNLYVEAIENYRRFLGFQEQAPSFPPANIIAAIDNQKLKSADVMNELAQLLVLHGDTNDARAIYKLILKRHPEHLSAGTHLIDLELATLPPGEDDASQFLENLLKERREAVFYDPNDAQSHFLLGYLYIKLGKERPSQRDELRLKAVEELRKALDIDPSLKECAWVLKDVLLQEQAGDTTANYARALELSSQAASAAPQSAEAQYQLGLTFLAGEDFDKAQAAFKQAIEVDPSHMKAYSELVSLYTRNASYEEATELCEHVKRLNPN